MKKVCSKCNIEKPLSDFYKRGNGLRSDCKDCCKEYHKIFILKNPNYNKNYYKANREKEIEKVKRYQSKNRGKISLYNKNYYKNNKKKCDDLSRQWICNNKDKFLQRLRDRNLKNYRDPVKSLRYRVSSTLHKTLKRKSKKSSEYLKCDYDTLLNHLNNNPYGFMYGDKGLDIDHIIPLSSASTQEELEKLLIYTNLQLLPSYYNRHIKRNKTFNKKEFEKWLKREK